MFCRKCGRKIAEDSLFCNYCGAKAQDLPSAAPTPAPPSVNPTGPQAFGVPKAPAPDEPEQTLWEGRFCGRALGHWYILWAVWFLILSYFYFLRIDSKDRTSLLQILFLVLAFVPLLYLGFVHLRKRFAIRYKLTTHRLFREEGVFSRRTSEIELFRVDDVAVDQGILQRVFNVGNVLVISHDALEPKLELTGISRPIETKEQIRTVVRQRRARTMYMENI